MSDNRRRGLVFLVAAWLMVFALCLALLFGGGQVQQCGPAGTDLCLIDPGFEVFFIWASIVVALGLGIGYVVPWERLRGADSEGAE